MKTAVIAKYNHANKHETLHHLMRHKGYSSGLAMPDVLTNTIETHGSSNQVHITLILKNRKLREIT